jgi:hypothetical protein
MAGPFVIACVLLGVAGGAKVADPGPTRGALRALGLPATRVLVIMLGVAELATAVSALIVGGRWAAGAVAVFYLGFAGFVAVALRRETPLSSCGCFGREDTPPTAIHLAVNLTFAAVAVVLIVDPVGPLDTVLADQPAAGVPFVGWVAMGTYAAYLLLSVMPRTLARVGPRRRAVP